MEGLSGIMIKTPIKITVPPKRSMPRGMEVMPYYTASIGGDGDMVNKEPADIGGIQVGIMRPDDVREMSAVHVTTHEAFIKDAAE